MKGYIHVYTGNGKGKTTAALGLALRAAGAGKKVYFAQFVKGKIYSEIDAINRYIPEVTIKQYGRGCFIVNEPTSEDIQAAKEGLEEIRAVIRSEQYDVVVLNLGSRDGMTIGDVLAEAPLQVGDVVKNPS